MSRSRDDVDDVAVDGDLNPSPELRYQRFRSAWSVALTQRSNLPVARFSTRGDRTAAHCSEGARSRRRTGARGARRTSPTAAPPRRTSSSGAARRRAARRSTVAPSALLSFVPSGRRMSGWWAKSAAPRGRAARRAGSGARSPRARSSPRTTRSTPWRRSSTTTHRAYVQLPFRSRMSRSPDGRDRARLGPTQQVVPGFVAVAQGDAQCRRPGRGTRPRARQPPGQPGPDHDAPVRLAATRRTSSGCSRRRRRSATLAAARAPRRTPGRRRSGGRPTGPARRSSVEGSSAAMPSRSRSSRSAASYSGRQRWRSWSSMRRSTRAPKRRARPQT